jgi:uncharacterized protein YbjT (DUF2867 family)
MEKKILITGATGSIGSNAVAKLLELGFPVRALVRKEDDRANALAKLGAEVVIGDLSDFNSISAAMRGVSRVLFIYPLGAGLIEATAYISQAAQEENVEVIVNISQRTSSRTAISHSAQDTWISERALDWSGVPVVHLRPTLFMDWLKYFSQTIKGQNIYIPPFGDEKVGMIDTEDIARVAAAILADPNGHIGKTYELNGPEEINGTDIAAILSEVLGRKIQFANITPEAFGQILEQAGSPAYNNQHLVAIGHMFQTGEFRGMTNNVVQISGKKPLSIREFIVKNRSLF